MSRSEIFETLILFLAIGSFWPLILGWKTPLANALPLLFLPVLLWMARRRLRRFREALKTMQKSQERPPDLKT